MLKGAPAAGSDSKVGGWQPAGQGPKRRRDLLLGLILIACKPANLQMVMNAGWIWIWMPNRWSPGRAGRAGGLENSAMQGPVTPSRCNVENGLVVLPFH